MGLCGRSVLSTQTACILHTEDMFRLFSEVKITQLPCNPLNTDMIITVQANGTFTQQKKSPDSSESAAVTEQ